MRVGIAVYQNSIEGPVEREVNLAGVRGVVGRRVRPDAKSVNVRVLFKVR
jgi:hypothetical protein